MLLTLTLDTNCIIAIEKNEPAAAALRDLVTKHHQALVELALVSVSAAERQPGDQYINSFNEFEDRANAAGLSNIPILSAMAFYGLSFWGKDAYGGTQASMERDRQIHQALFPTIPYTFADFAAKNGIAADLNAPGVKPWRNAFCDRQMYWAHDRAQREVFVTSDANFRKKLVGHPDFPTACIATPDEALQLV